MQNTVNKFDKRYFYVTPVARRYLYSCKDCGEVVSDRTQHDAEHRRRNNDPVVVFAKMSEIVTILWGLEANGCY